MVAYDEKGKTKVKIEFNWSDHFAFIQKKVYGLTESQIPFLLTNCTDTVVRCEQGIYFKLNYASNGIGCVESAFWACNDNAALTIANFIDYTPDGIAFANDLPPLSICDYEIDNWTYGAILELPKKYHKLEYASYDYDGNYMYKTVALSGMQIHYLTRRKNKKELPIAISFVIH